MMSIQTIARLADEAARKARQDGACPFVPYDDNDPITGIPFLGDYVPKGWCKTNEQWFVDSSGFGGENESALTLKAFQRLAREWIKTCKAKDKAKGKLAEYGLGVVEAGQFQVYVAGYRKAIR